MKSTRGDRLRDFILGAQDGIVNVLALVLGVASATGEIKTVLIAGIAGLFAESISMGAVAFTSSEAARDYYRKIKDKEAHHYKNPLAIGWLVFFATILGSLIPIIPFFFMNVVSGIFTSVALSGIFLFAIGAVKGKITTGKWVSSGIKMTAIGLIAALIGFAIGLILGNLIGTTVIV